MKALMVIDALNGFFRESLITMRHAMYWKYFDQIVPYMVEQCERFDRDGSDIIFVGDSHHEWDVEFEVHTWHCLEGTGEAQVIDELKDYADRHFVVKKSTYSGFYNTELDTVLRNMFGIPLGVSQEGRKEITIEVVGVCTEICVLYTVEELRNRGYQVLIHRRGIHSPHSELAHAAMYQMEHTLGAKFVE